MQPIMNNVRVYDMEAALAPTRFDVKVLASLTDKQLGSLLMHSPPAVFARDCAEFLAKAGIKTILNSAEIKAIGVVQAKRGVSSVRPVYLDDNVLSNGLVVIARGPRMPDLAPVASTAATTAASSTVPMTVNVKIATTKPLAPANEVVIDGVTSVLAPIPFSDPVRPGTQRLAVLTGMFVTVSDGEWVSNVNLAALKKVYREENMNVTNVFDYSRRIAEALNCELRWQQMSVMRRNSVTGGLRAIHLVEFFHGLSDGDFGAWQTLVSYTIYTKNTMHPVTGKGCRDLEKTGTSLVPSTLWKAWQPAHLARVLSYANGAPPRFLSDKLAIDVKVKLHTTEEEIKKLFEFVSTVGSYGTVPFMLFQNKNYTGMMSERGRRLSTIISIAFGLFHLQKKVAIACESVGDIATLVHSLDHWIKLFKVPAQYVLIVADNMLGGVTSKYRDRVETLAPVGFVRINWLNNGLPTSESKGSQVKWRESAAQTFPYANDVSYVTYGAIYSDFMFGGAQKVGTTDVVEKKAPLNGRVVEWGDCSEAKTLYTNVPGFMPMALLNDGEYYLQMMALPIHTSTETWYKTISNHCGLKLASWFGPTTRIGSMINWLRPCRDTTAQAIFQRFVEAGVCTEGEIAKFMHDATVAPEDYSVFKDGDAAIEVEVPPVDVAGDDDDYAAFNADAVDDA